MPFDKISPSQMFIMRVVTALTFLVCGGVIAALAGQCSFESEQCSARLQGPSGDAFYLVTLLFGVLLASAGLMLAELVTKPPLKLAINVPFVAANFQVALCFGLVASAFAAKHFSAAGLTSESNTIAMLTFAGCGLNLFFVVMTKLHWNFTENTGKPLA